MKSVCVSVLVWLAAQALPVGAADAGIYTIVEGSARVLRGAVWSPLVAGVRVQEGDVLDLADGAVAQAEMPRGGIVNVAGPAAALAGTQSGDAKSGVSSEWILTRGWMKAAGDASGLRVRLPQASIDIPNAIIVLKADPDSMQMFVESGSPKISPTGVKAPPREAHAGEWWSRSGDRPYTVATHMPQTFIAATPRAFMETLPKLAERYAGRPAPALRPGVPISFAEAEAWLATPFRALFIRRLQSRLTDPAFRVGVESRAAAYPEWDRLLHPERYP